MPVGSPVTDRVEINFSFLDIVIMGEEPTIGTSRPRKSRWHTVLCWIIWELITQCDTVDTSICWCKGGSRISDGGATWSEWTPIWITGRQNLSVGRLIIWRGCRYPYSGGNNISGAPSIFKGAPLPFQGAPEVWSGGECPHFPYSWIHLCSVYIHLVANESQKQ